MTEDRYTRITLRIPKDLYAELQRSADETSKSINAEIVNRLSDSFDAIDSDVAAQLQGQLKLQTELANEKNFQLELLKTATNAQAALISVMGYSMGRFASRLWDRSTNQGKAMFDILDKIGEDIAHKEYSSALPRLIELLDQSANLEAVRKEPEKLPSAEIQGQQTYAARARAIYETGHDPANRPNLGTQQAYQDIPKKKGKSNPDKPKTKPKDGDVW